DRNRSHWSTSKTPSYTKSVSWQHHLRGVTEAAMISKHSFVLSGNKNGKNKTGMAVSVTAMFISQYAGKNYS
ncbi:hypothetical protein P2R16_24410, partial [Escherichia coli]|nr:hypothetical protein [Escherichia coli]MCK2566682.1 hypothetical protein [Escherichia coli]